jgi:hypothetical protein
MFCPEEVSPKTFPNTCETPPLFSNEDERLEIPPKCGYLLNYVRSQSLFYPENRGKWFFRNADTYLPNSTASLS